MNMNLIMIMAGNEGTWYYTVAEAEKEREKKKISNRRPRVNQRLDLTAVGPCQLRWFWEQA